MAPWKKNYEFEKSLKVATKADANNNIPIYILMMNF